MAISSNYSESCSNNTGGVVNIYLTDRDNVTSFTASGTDEFNATTMATGKYFHSFAFEQDTAEYRSNGARENNSFAITHEIEFYLNKISTAQRKAMQDIVDSSTCGIIAIVEDANGLKRVFGYSDEFKGKRPMKASAIVSVSGKAFTDANGSTVTLESIDKTFPRILTSAVPLA